MNSGLLTEPDYGLGGIAVDAVGNVYVGERLTKRRPCVAGGPDDCLFSSGGTVWKLSPTGLVSKVWTSASVAPLRIAIDSSGNLYLGTTYLGLPEATASDDTMVKLSPEGVVLGQFSEPLSSRPGYREFAVDVRGNLVVASFNRVRKISPAGVTTEFGLAGSSGAVDGVGATARFSEISGLASDISGNIFVADSLNHAVPKISPAGIVSTVVGRLGSAGLVLGDLPGSLYRAYRVVTHTHYR